jgi:hypothetical protein
MSAPNTWKVYAPEYKLEFWVRLVSSSTLDRAGHALQSSVGRSAWPRVIVIPMPVDGAIWVFDVQPPLGSVQDAEVGILGAPAPDVDLIE